MVHYLILSLLLLNFASGQFASFAIKANSESILYDRSKDEYRERYKELVGMYPISTGNNGGIFIDNIEVLGTVNEGDMGTLTVKIKNGETESSVAASCSVMDLTFASLGKHLLCSILTDYDIIVGINPMSSDTITFTDYEKVKKYGEASTSGDGSTTSGDDTTTSSDITKKNSTSTTEGTKNKSGGESFLRGKLEMLILGLLLL